MKDKVKVAFLDRDGVINRKAAEHDYIKKPEEFQLLKGVPAAIRLLNHYGYKVIIVTNQRGIARKLMTKADLTTIHEKMHQELAVQGAFVDKIYYCPHDIIDNCSCRKPKIGMLLQAEAEYPVNKSLSFMVGDSLSDIQAGISFGVSPILIGEAAGSFPCAADLLTAVRKLILTE